MSAKQVSYQSGSKAGQTVSGTNWDG